MFTLVLGFRFVGLRIENVHAVLLAPFEMVGRFLSLAGLLLLSQHFFSLLLSNEVLLQPLDRVFVSLMHDSLGFFPSELLCELFFELLFMDTEVAFLTI